MVWTDRKFDQQSQRQGDHRSSFQRDKARVLHSAAFRRLQAKTQVLGVGMSDFYRTRLTHSLEASQIGQGIAAQLRNKYPDLTETLGLNEQLIETLCLAHDIGHPPFGHGGEVALNYMMRSFGGFEGNGQTFRIVTKLEPYTAEAGMNLSRRTVLGLIKYPNFIDSLTNTSCLSEASSTKHIKASEWHPAKGLFSCDNDMFEWVISPLCQKDREQFLAYSQFNDKHSKTLRKSFDCSIMELADDIAYGIHDLEDAIVMGIVNIQQFSEEVASPIRQLALPWLSQAITNITSKLFSSEHHERKDAIGALVNTFITAIEICNVEADFEQPLLRHNARLPDAYEGALSEFKRFVFRRVIRKPEIQLLEYKGQMVVMELFEAFASDPERLLPENTRVRWLKAAENSNGERVIADYISGMTDEFAARLYNTLFMPKVGGLSDTLGG